MPVWLGRCGAARSLGPLGSVCAAVGLWKGRAGPRRPRYALPFPSGLPSLLCPLRLAVSQVLAFFLPAHAAHIARARAAWWWSGVGPVTASRASRSPRQSEGADHRGAAGCEEGLAGVPGTGAARSIAGGRTRSASWTSPRRTAVPPPPRGVPAAQVLPLLAVCSVALARGRLLEFPVDLHLRHEGLRGCGHGGKSAWTELRRAGAESQTVLGQAGRKAAAALVPVGARALGLVNKDPRPFAIRRCPGSWIC